jgi:predicted ATPase/class 3 adenylate cyclase
VIVKSVTRALADPKEVRGRIFTISRGICAESPGGSSGTSARETGPDLLRCMWALVGSNHRPPPCKGGQIEGRYRGKRAKAQMIGTSGFDPLPFLAVGLNGFCVLFAYSAEGNISLGCGFAWGSRTPEDGFLGRASPSTIPPRDQMRALPTGTVTFLFTDIEGSTRLLQRLGDRYREVVHEHGRILRQAIASGGGTEVHTEGDSFFAVFPTPAGALAAAVEAQRGLASHPWPESESVQARMGLHTGEGVLGGDDYIGLDVHRAARIAAAGHGGQVLLSQATKDLIEYTLPDGVSPRDLGRHRLKDIEHPEHLYDLVIEGLRSEFPAVRTLDARPTNLPPQRTSFVGRNREVAEVTSLLAQTRLLTLTGPGGTGKTRLALRVAADHLDRFADGVFFADLSPIVDPALVSSVIAQALLVREETGRDILDTLADHLRDRQILLVLDNSEQVIEAGPAIARLLGAAPGLTVLATSRTPFHVSGEHEYQIPPLAVPDPTADLDVINRSEATALFAERAAAIRRGFRITSQNAPAVAEIAARLDGLPLAIELAASRLNVLSPEALLDRLAQRLSLLTGGPRDLPHRQRTLRNTIEWSHDLLDAHVQRLFARLATFNGGWRLEAAEAICGPGLDLEVLDGLGTLIDHSMVRRAGLDGEPRFSMLETVREFAVERLAACGEEAELRRRHAEHFRDLAEEAERHLTRQDRVVWLARLEEDHDNLRAALDWSEVIGDADSALRNTAAIWRFWLQRGHLSEGRARLERLLSMPGGAAPGPVRARALAALGGIAYWQNDYPPTRAAYEEAVAIAREVGDPRLLASALLDLSYIPYLEQEPDRSEAILREGLARAEEAGDRVLTAEFLSSIGFLEVVRGNPAAAIEPRRIAIEILRQEGAAWQLGQYLGGQAMITRMVGDLPAAKRHLHEALAMFAQARDSLSISMTLTSLALVANDEGHHERASRLVGAAARIRDELGGGVPPELADRWGDPGEDARGALGEDGYQRARAEGYAMDGEEAVAYAVEDRE